MLLLYAIGQKSCVSRERLASAVQADQDEDTALTLLNFKQDKVYLFGAKAPDADKGAIPVRSVADLETYFTPFQEVAGRININDELQRYQPFSDLTHSFGADALNLQGSLADGSPPYATSVGQVEDGGVKIGAKLTPLSKLGLHAPNLGKGQIVGFRHVHDIYFVAELRGDSVLLQSTSHPGEEISIPSTIAYTLPYYILQPTDSVTNGATEISVSDASRVRIGGMIARGGDGDVITRDEDYRVTAISGGKIKIDRPLSPAMSSDKQDGRFYVTGPAINSAQIWTKEYFDLHSPDASLALDFQVTLPPDPEGGFDSRTATDLESFHKAPSSFPWGAWPAIWLYAGRDDCPKCEQDGSEIDIMEMYWNTTNGPWAISGNNIPGANGGAETRVYARQDTDWSHDRYGFFARKSAALTGTHRIGIIIKGHEVRRYFDGMLLSQDDFNWSSTHKAQLGLNLAIGSLAPGQTANMLGPFNEAGFANMRFSIRKIVIYRR